MYLLDQVLPAIGDMILAFYRDLVLHCVLDVLNMLVSILYSVCMYALDYILPDIGDMILAAGVWCCTCAALNVLSRPCTILCERQC